MKRVLLYAIALSFAFASCETENGDDDLKNNVQIENTETPNDPNAPQDDTQIVGGVTLPNDCVQLSLSELTSTNYPANSDNWIITDTSATVEDFEGLRSVLDSIAGSDRSISIYFTKMIELPEKALMAGPPIKGSKESVLTAVYAFSATTIGDYAFDYRSTLKTASFPVAKTIGNYAFKNCYALTSTLFPAAFSVGYGAFRSCAALKTIPLPVAATIGDYAFAGCSALTEVSFPAAITVGRSAFSSCTALKEVSLPLATNIDDYAFAECSALTEISLPAVTIVGEYIFSSCTSLTTVSLPVIREIGPKAFSNCTALTDLEIAIKSTIVMLGSNMFGKYNDDYSVSVNLVIGTMNSGFNYGNRWQKYTFKTVTATSEFDERYY